VTNLANPVCGLAMAIVWRLLIVKPPVDYPIDNAMSSSDSANIDGAASDSVSTETAQKEGTLAALRHRHSINKPVTPEMIQR